MPLLGSDFVKQVAGMARQMVVIFVLVLILVSPSNAAETKSNLTREYDLKAAFLFNFTQFVDWPPESFPTADTPFVIGVLGDDPFGNSLDEIVANETVGGHKIVVRRYRDVQEIETCHILFISQSEAPRLEQIFAFLQEKSILTVGETDGFSMRAGMIRFVLIEKKLRIKINANAAKIAKLTISSKLLRQAEIVNAKRGN